MKNVKAILDSLNLFEASGKLDQTIAEKVKATIAELKTFKERKPTKQTVILQEANDLINQIKDELPIVGNFTALKESSFDDSGIIPIKVIGSGWGSSGYYSDKVLEEGASIYKPGTLMFWDHPTLTEDYERPERSLRDLAGVIVSEGKFNKDGADGPGVYAEAKVYKHYREVIKDLGNDIGISHVAEGVTKFGEAEGQEGMIVESLERAFSVDYVTQAGAKGQIATKFAEAKTKETEQLTLEDLKKNHPKIIEAFRKEIKDSIYGTNDKNKKAKEAKEMSELTELQEANKKLADEKKIADDKLAETLKENVRFKEAELLKEAGVIVGKEIKDSELPDITKKRLIESLTKEVVIEDGKIDKDKFKENIKKAVDAEIVYLSKLNESGDIKGMGTSEGGDGDKEKIKEATEKFEASLIEGGMSKEAAKRAAQGR